MKKISYLLLALVSCEVNAAQMYTIKKIVSTPTLLTNAAIGINASGQVVGLGYNKDSEGHPFLYDGSSIHDLGTLGGRDGLATAINDSGKVVGYTNTGFNQPFHGFIYDSAGMHDIGSLIGSESKAYSINSSGQVVGSSNIGSYVPQNHAFLYDSGKMKDLGTFGGTSDQLSQSAAEDINASGQIVGYSGQDSNKKLIAKHAFLYNSSGMHDLGTLAGSNVDVTGYNSDAHAINGNGQIVGESMLSDGRTHAFLYDSTGMHDLGAPGKSYENISSVAKDINASGKIVGFYDTKANGYSFQDIGNHTAFLYDSEGMHDLNTLLVANPDQLTVNDAAGINDNGQIAATGLDKNYNLVPLLLTPATNPPPPTGTTVTLTASPTSISSGGSTTLTWSSANATYCSATTSAGFSGEIPLSGNATLTQTVTTTYNLSCTGASGSNSQSVTVAVNTPADCLFNWAETNYPSLFAPAGSATLSSSPYNYRYYKTTNSYVGVSSANNHVYYLDPKGSLQDVGDLMPWLTKSGCSK